MATKKEIIVTKDTNPALVELVRKAGVLQDQISDLQTQEKVLKTQITTQAEAIRTKEEIDKTNYIGLIKVVDEDQPTSQVQFKICNGGLAETEGPVLEGHFGSDRVSLFEKGYAVQNILDPDALITEMKTKSLNPWDYLNLSVKPNLDRTFKDSNFVTIDQAYLPVEGFLVKLNNIKHTLSIGAKAYITKYLAVCLKPSIVLGKQKERII